MLLKIIENPQECSTQVRNRKKETIEQLRNLWAFKLNPVTDCLLSYFLSPVLYEEHVIYKLKGPPPVELKPLL